MLCHYWVKKDFSAPLPIPPLLEHLDKSKKTEILAITGTFSAQRSEYGTDRHHHPISGNEKILF